MKKTEKLTKTALASFVAAALIAGGASCSSGESKSGGESSSADSGSNSAETEAPASQDEQESTTPDDTTAVSTTAAIDPKTADYSKVDITIPFGSGSQIVDFTNDMLAGKYDGMIVRCEGITSRRSNGNAMMQVQDDGSKRGFTWYIVDSDDPGDYPPEDAQAEITGIVGIGEYDVRYLYVLPENVVLKSGAEDEVYGTGYLSGDPDDPFYGKRDVLNNEGAPIGVRYLGYIEYDVNDPSAFMVVFRNILEITGSNDGFAFTDEMIKQNFAATGDGTELYMIIPASDEMTVEVWTGVLDEDTAALSKGNKVYSSGGDPFLLKCNVSEVIPDSVIVITDKDGNSFEWSPAISGMDGTVVIKNAAGRKIKDFTDYSRLATTDDVPRG